MFEILVVFGSLREDLKIVTPVVPVAGDIMYFPKISGRFRVKSRTIDLDERCEVRVFVELTDLMNVAKFACSRVR